MNYRYRICNHKHPKKETMEEQLHVMITKKEKRTLKQQASEYGLSISEYVRRKLVHENEDLSAEARYVSPPQAKHNLVVATALLKILYLVRQLVIRQPDITSDTLSEIDESALQFARNNRLEYGYKLLKPKNN